MIIPESEHGLLAILLMNPSLIDQCTLSQSDFSYENAGVVYGQMLESHQNNTGVDIVLVAEELQRKTGQLHWASFVADIVGNINCNPRMLDDYQNRIKLNSRKRKAKHIAYELQEDIESVGLDAIDSAIQGLMKLQGIEERYERTITEILKQALIRVDERFKSDELPGLSTGLKDLDECSGGFRNGEFYVIGARPSVGKTALLLNMAVGANRPIGIISSEQDGGQLGERLFSIVGGIHAGRVRNGKLEEDDWPKLTMCVNQLRNREIYTNDEAGITLNKIIAQARKWKYQNNIGGIYIDYLQRIETFPGEKTIDRVSAIARGFKNISRQLDIPVIALGQVKRDVDTRANKRPGLSDLSDSSEIEKETDGIIMLYRDDVYNEDSPDKGIAELDWVKNRSGPTGVIRCVFRPNLMQFKNIRGD